MEKSFVQRLTGHLASQLSAARMAPIAPLRVHPEFPRFTLPERLHHGKLWPVQEGVKPGEYDG